MVGTGLRAELPAIGYAGGNFGKNLLWTAGEVTLLFLLTEVFGIPPLMAGALLLASLAVDILIDVTAGRLAAGALARGKGYRHRMLVAAVPCAVGFGLLYALPLSGSMAALPVIAALLLYRIGYAFVDVPHNSLLAVVATDSRRRGRIAGYRSLFSALAGVAVATLLAPAVVGAATDGNTRGTALWGLVAAFLFLLSILIVWIATADVEQGSATSASVPARIPLLPRLTGDLLRLLTLACLAGFAMPMLARNMLHLATYGFGNPAAATPLLTALTLGQIAGIGFWSWLVHRAEKRTALMAANLAAAIAVLAFALAPPDWRTLAAVAAGFALSGVFMLPWAVIGDIVDADHLRDGQRREAQSFAALLVALKGGAALGILASGWVLGRAGVGNDGARILPELVAMLAFVPVIGGGMMSALLIRKLEISHLNHARIESELRRRTTVG